MIENLIAFENGGKIDVYQMVDRAASDFEKIYTCCEYFAKQGARTIIAPRFDYVIGNPVYECIYASLKGTPYWGKCPDFSVNGVWYEHEGFDEEKDLSTPQKRADTFSLMIRRGIKQSDRLVVEDSGFGRSYARRTIFNRVYLENQDIKEVFVRTPKGLELIYKKESGLTLASPLSPNP